MSKILGENLLVHLYNIYGEMVHTDMNENIKILQIELMQIMVHVHIIPLSVLTDVAFIKMAYT